MSLAYPATLNQIIYHQLQFPFGGICEIENASRFYVYVALTPRATASDIINQQVATIPPYQRRAFKQDLHGLTPTLSILPTNTPWAFAGTIGGSQDLVRINEYSNPKAFFPQQNFDGLAADYVIVAGGRLQLNQFGEFIQDNFNKPVFAILGQSGGPTWDGATLHVGDLVIGPYFSGTQGLYWDAVNQELNIKGAVTVLGGNARTVQFIDGTWTPINSTTVSYTGVKVGLNNGQVYTVNNGSINTAVPAWLYIDISGSSLPPVNLQQTPNLQSVVYPFILVGVWTPNADATQVGSIMIQKGFTKISSDRIGVTSLAALSVDAGALTAGTLTGLLIRTAASGNRIELSGNRENRYADTGTAALDRWLRTSDSAALASVLGYDNGASLNGGFLTLDAFTRTNTARSQAQLTAHGNVDNGGTGQQTSILLESQDATLTNGRITFSAGGVNHTLDNTLRINAPYMTINTFKIGSGTSFPTGANTGDRFFRTDQIFAAGAGGLDCYFDGTRWLTVQEYVQTLELIVISGVVDIIGKPLRTDFFQYFSRLVGEFVTGTPNNISNYWLLSIRGISGSFGGANVIGSLDTSGLAPNVFGLVENLAAFPIPANHAFWDVLTSKTGAPGNIQVTLSVYWRLVIP